MDPRIARPINRTGVSVNASTINGSPVVLPSGAGMPLTLRGDTLSRTIQSQPAFIAGPPIGLEIAQVFGTAIITVQPGQAVMTIGTRGVGVLTQAMSKRLAPTWVTGDSATGLFNQIALTDATYHVFLLWNPTTYAVDLGFDTDLFAVNRPAGWSARRIGSIIQSGGQILQFEQNGINFLHKNAIADLRNFVPSVSGTLYTLTLPQIQTKVTGILATGYVDWTTGTQISFMVQCPNIPYFPPQSSPPFTNFRGLAGTYAYINGTDTCIQGSASQISVYTNASAQIRISCSATNFNTAGYPSWQTLGWEDFLLLRGM